MRVTLSVDKQWTNEARPSDRIVCSRASQKVLQNGRELQREKQRDRMRRKRAAKYACYQVKLKRIQQSMLGRANTAQWRCSLLFSEESCRWSGSSFQYVPTKPDHLNHTDMSACNQQSSSLLPGNIERHMVKLASLFD